MGELADWSIEEQMFPDLNLIYSLDLSKREAKRLENLRKKFVWTDRRGEKYRLADIDDFYLANIISFLKRKVQTIPLVEDMPFGSEGSVTVNNEEYIDSYQRIIDFLEWEQKRRGQNLRMR